jgi:CTP synthase (UTP-ammonia lyase)
MQKISNLIIILFLVFTLGKINLTSADFIEDTLGMDTKLEEMTLKLYSLENPRLNNKKNQKQYYKINRLNNKIKIALIKKYKDN